MTIKIFTTGGTFDKIYFDKMSEFHIGDPIIPALLEEANVDFEFDVESLLKKDSLDMDEAEQCVEKSPTVVWFIDRQQSGHRCSLCPLRQRQPLDRNAGAR